MATITNYFLSKPPPSLSNFSKTTPLNFNSFSISPSSVIITTRPKFQRTSQRGLLFSVKATAASGSSSATKKASNERVQRVHSIEEFDEALRNAKNRLVVVEFAESDSLNSQKIYPFMVDLSRTCNDVDFLLVMGDESEKTRELCRREKIDKVNGCEFFEVSFHDHVNLVSILHFLHVVPVVFVWRIEDFI